MLYALLVFSFIKGLVNLMDDSKNYLNNYGADIYIKL